VKDTPGAELIGCLIKATAPGKRTMRGVVLPPAAGARTPLPRLDGDVSRRPTVPMRFNPDDWTITVEAGPDYSYGNLPAEQLATATMLRTELRLMPNGKVLGTYRTRDGAAALYAVADAVPMAPLSPARAAAWTAARTCIRCGEAKRRPLPNYPSAGRLCDTCQATVAAERWTERARAAQADAAAWARDILAGPNILLIARDGNYDRPHVRVEWLTALSQSDGDPLVIFDGRLRKVDEPRHFDDEWWTPERIQAWHDKYEGTMPPSEFRKIVESYGALRIIAWSERDRWFDVENGLPFVAAGDELGERLALWSGEAPHRSGNWYPEPRLPWGYYPQHFPLHTTHRALRHAGNLPAEIASMRMLLHVMAGNPASEPTHGPVVVAR
jgi:hypothetical protein